MRQSSRLWSGWMCGDQGSALVEFAILLALVVASVAASMMLLGDQSAQTFARLDGRGTAPPATASLEQRPARAQDLAPNDPLSIAATPAGAAADGSREITLDQRALAFLIGGVVIMAYAAVRWRVGSRKRTVEQIDEGRELLEQIDDKRFAKRQDIFKVLAADPQALLENRLEVRHVMTTRLRNVRPKTPLDEISAIMAEEAVRHFPVVSEKGTLVGIVSDRDLFFPDARFAADVMSRTLVTISPRAKLETAAAQMINRNISCLPVMENSTVVGIVTTTDLVMTLQCAFQLWRRQAQPGKSGFSAAEAAGRSELLAASAS